MPIVSHILESNTQANGSTTNIVRMYDQDAREYMQGFSAPPGFDLPGRVASMIAEWDVHLAEQEFRQFVGL